MNNEFVVDFLKQYDNVFDVEGRVLNCGRDECKKLIQLALKIHPSIIYGNLDTGYMHIENIQELYKECKEK